MDNNTKKVSFIVPAYNVQMYLKKCLISLQNQTLDDFEIIIVEDKSTDNTLSIAKRFAQEDDRITLILHKRNQGLGPARNTGLNHATGKYICFVDSDDWVDPGYGEAFYMEAERTGADMVVGTFYTVLSQGTKIFAHFVDPQVRYTSVPFNWRNCPAVLSMPTPVWDKCYKKEFLDRHNIRFPALIGEDIPFQWEALTQAKKISVVGEPFYYYRIRDTQNNKSLTSGRNIFADVFVSENLALQYLTQSKLLKEVESIWWERMIKEILHLTEKSGDTIINDNFIAKIFFIMFRDMVRNVNFSSINRLYMPDSIIFKAMFVRECNSWKEFRDLIAATYPASFQKRPRFFGVGKFKMVLTQHDVEHKQLSTPEGLVIKSYNASCQYYPDCHDYEAICYRDNKFILLPPIHDSNMKPAKLTICFGGDNVKRIWYLLECSQIMRRSELAIHQRVVTSYGHSYSEKVNILPVGEKIQISYLDLPDGVPLDKIEVEFYIKCVNGFPAWCSDVTISNFYGEKA